jgi:hypothetical protein
VLLKAKTVKKWGELNCFIFKLISEKDSEC